MKVVIQRVLNSSVVVDGDMVASIQGGLLVFLGVCQTDTPEHAEKLVEKIAKLRIFPDEEGKTNLSVTDIGGQLLVVSQFTLYAYTKKGNRPSFIDAADPEKANELYQYFIKCAQSKLSVVQSGVFGADMKVSATNDGPFTLILEI